MGYDAQLADLSEDDDDEATIVRQSPRHKVFAQGPTLPLYWERYFWATEAPQPVRIVWKNAERSETTQRILLPASAASLNSWRALSGSWKAKAGAVAMLAFFVSALAAIPLMIP